MLCLLQDSLCVKKRYNSGSITVELIRITLASLLILLFIDWKLIDVSFILGEINRFNSRWLWWLSGSMCILESNTKCGR